MSEKYISPLGNEYKYKIDATSLPFCWYLKVIRYNDRPSFPMRMRSRHVLGSPQRAERIGKRFINKLIRQDERQHEVNKKYNG